MRVSVVLLQTLTKSLELRELPGVQAFRFDDAVEILCVDDFTTRVRVHLYFSLARILPPPSTSTSFCDENDENESKLTEIPLFNRAWWRVNYIFYLWCGVARAINILVQAVMPIQRLLRSCSRT